eukprot:symbB.v1.2.013876.t1/scaffold991.1/size149480/11
MPANQRRVCFEPMVNNLLNDTSRFVSCAMLQQLGYFIGCLEDASSVPKTLLEEYLQVVRGSMANPDAADMSFHCAFTFAAVVRTMGVSEWPSLKAAFTALCADAQAKTRKAMAASCHIVAQALGPDLVEEEVLPSFEAFLQDPQLEVRMAAIKSVASLLQAVGRPTVQRNLLQALMSGMGKVKNWRCRHLAAQQLGPICMAFSPRAMNQVTGDAGSPMAETKDIAWRNLVPLFLQLCSDTRHRRADSWFQQDSYGNGEPTMGSGCFKGNTPYEPLASDEAPPGSAELTIKLQPVLRATSRAGKCSNQELDALLERLADASDEAAPWLLHWARRQTPKARSGLVALSQRLLSKVLRPKLLAAQQALKTAPGEGAEGVDFGKLASICEEALRFEVVEREGSKVLCQVLSGVSKLPATVRAEFVVQDLDAIVLLFQRAFIGQRASSASKQLVQLRELEAETGLPAVQDHLALLGGQAKGLLLGMLLVPEDTPPCTVVTARDGGLLDVASQLPGHTSILLPYFEDATGTKTVQGRRVEGGEGHGLRKEFFTSMSLDAQRRWGRLSISEGLLEPGPVACCGSRLKLQPLESPVSELHQLLMAVSNGDRIKLAFTTGQESERIVTGNMPMPGGGSSVIVDKPFEENLSELTIKRCEVQKPAQPLFEFHRGTGQQWFSSHANSLHDTVRGESLAVRYRAFGKLMALALANHCKLSFALPLLFFQFLLQRERVPQLDDLKGFDNALHSSLRKCLKMKAAQFKQIKELEGLSPDMTLDHYVQDQLKAILCPQAFEEVRQGFWSLIPSEILEDVTPPELRQIVCPTTVVREDMGLRQIFRVVFEDDMSECQPLVEAFHSVLDSLSNADKKRFLMFVTGIEVPPEPGTEQLTVQMPFSAFTKDEHVEMLGKLPQAHTCTNTLELPNYYESLQELMGKECGRYEPQEGKATRALMTELKNLLKERLHTAINETDSYELDATEDRCSAVVVPPAPLAPWAPSPVGSTVVPPALHLSKGISQDTESSGSPSVATRLRVKDSDKAASSDTDSYPPQLSSRSIQSLKSDARTSFEEIPQHKRLDVDSLLASLEEEADSRHAPSPDRRPKTLQDVDSLLEDLDAALMT